MSKKSKKKNKSGKAIQDAKSQKAIELTGSLFRILVLVFLVMYIVIPENVVSLIGLTLAGILFIF